MGCQTTVESEARLFTNKKRKLGDCKNTEKHIKISIHAENREDQNTMATWNDQQHQEASEVWKVEGIISWTLIYRVGTHI